MEGRRICDTQEKKPDKVRNDQSVVTKNCAMAQRYKLEEVSCCVGLNLCIRHSKGCTESDPHPDPAAMALDSFVECHLGRYSNDA